MNIADRLKNIEFLLLCLLAITLPVLEAPKNLAVVLLFGTWLMRCVLIEPPRQRQPDRFELALIWLVAAAAISTALNWPSISGLKGVKDTTFGAFVCWVAYRGNFSTRHNYLLATMLALGVVMGLIWGVTDVLRGLRTTLEFNSAGIVTQSSIYLGIIIVMCFGIAYTETGRSRTMWIAAIVLMLFGIFLMASRGSILAVGILGLLFGLARGTRKSWLIGLLMLLLTAGTSLLIPNLFNQTRYIEKGQLLLQSRAIDQNDSVRFSMWRIGAAEFTQGSSQIFGIGPRKFSAIDTSKLHFDHPLNLLDKRLNHAHNLFLTKLVEEGLFGLAALLYLFGLVSTTLVRDWRSRNQLDWPWFGALGGVAIPIIAGSFNTPWYQEHALLAMMLFGIYFATRKRKARVDVATV